MGRRVKYGIVSCRSLASGVESAVQWVLEQWRGGFCGIWSVVDCRHPKAGPPLHVQHKAFFVGDSSPSPTKDSGVENPGCQIVRHV